MRPTIRRPRRRRSLAARVRSTSTAPSRTWRRSFGVGPLPAPPDRPPSTPTARATPTVGRLRGATAPWSTSIPSSASCGWCRSPPPRTSGGRSTRPCVARAGGGRHRPGPRAGGDGGDRAGRRQSRNPSFTDYLIPTALDMPDVDAALDRGARARGAVRGQGRGRAAGHLVHPGHRRGHPRRRPRARCRPRSHSPPDHPSPRPPQRHRPLTPPPTVAFPQLLCQSDTSCRSGTRVGESGLKRHVG